jgi:transposase
MGHKHEPYRETAVSGDVRPAVLAKHAAKKLGVSVELVEGLVKAKKLGGYRSTGQHGGTVWMVYKDEVERLREFMLSR